jgi:hypothetical protein
MADILIGLGGTGGKILKAFRQRLWTDYTEEERRKLPIGFIYVDSDKKLLDLSDGTYDTIHGNCCFTEEEFIDIKKDSEVDAIFLNSGAHPKLQGVIGNVSETQSAVCPVGEAADQKRRAGRILFASNIDKYVEALKTKVGEVRSVDVGGILNIYIFAGLAGGTGSGSIIDAVVQTRKWLFEHNISEKQFKFMVFCQIPENTPPAGWDKERYKPNGYAALVELNNLFSSIYNKEWAGRCLKPPFDVTSDVSYARAYLTYEEPTPDNIREGRIPQELKIAGGLILYSNKNDKNFVITDPYRLSELVANFVYTWIFMPGGDAREEFARFMTFENMSSSREEFDETVDAEIETPVPVRTRAIGSFGIKRIVVPDSALQEHIAYTLGLGALNQFKYMNWSPQTGYRDTPLTFDPITYINDEGRRASWKLSADHLMLKKYILEGDSKEKWPEGSFSNYWTPCIDAWAQVARSSKTEFSKLIELCRGGYETGFRNKGVERFFGDKVAAINDAYSKVVADEIEKYLFNEWANNKLSLFTLEEITSKLVKQIGDEDKRITEVDVPKLEDKIRTNETAIQGVVNDYNNSNIIVRTATFGNKFAKVTELCKTLYVQKTELAALRIFTVPLCTAIKSKLEDLHSRVIKFISQTNELIDTTKQRMSNLADISKASDTDNNDGTENMMNPVIEFYSRQRMKSLEERLNCDREKMDSMSSVIRREFVNSLQSDGRFLNVERMNGKALSRALLGEVYSQIKTFHDKLCVDPGQRVLGMPILRRLYQKYGNNPEALRKFAEDVITASGVLTEIDMNQISMKLDNNAPSLKGKNIMVERIIVSLPRTDDPDLVSFAEDLKRALKSSIQGGSGASIAVDTNNPNQNEITVIMLVNGFPIRAISAVPMLKAEYDKLIAQDPKNKIVLLTEGRDGDYRGIFAKKPKSPADIRDEKVPQLIVLLGLGKLVRDNATEEYGVGEKDFFGNDAVTPWGESARKFTEMVYDDRLMGERKSQITKLFNEALANAYEGVDVVVRAEVESKKAQLKAALMTRIGAVMKEEAPSRQAYNDFVKWTEAAVNSVLEYKPKN